MRRTDQCNPILLMRGGRHLPSHGMITPRRWSGNSSSVVWVCLELICKIVLKHFRRNHQYDLNTQDQLSISIGTVTRVLTVSGLKFLYNLRRKNEKCLNQDTKWKVVYTTN